MGRIPTKKRRRSNEERKMVIKKLNDDDIVLLDSKGSQRGRFIKYFHIDQVPLLDGKIG